MTPTQKATILIAKFTDLTGNADVAKTVALLFTEEMIKTFERIVVVYSRDFKKSVNFWQEVKQELLSL